MMFFVISGFSETKVLFLGNSYTAGNDLPGIFRNLAESAGHSVYVDSKTPGGYTLRYHFEDAASLDLIESNDWDYVVLQEQSQVPVIPYFRDNWMIPYAMNLCNAINDNCSRAVFFMAWGAEIGGQECVDVHCSIEFEDYFHQQDSVSASYEMVAEFNNASCAPAGLAWRLSQEIDPELGLWSGDGRHPNLNGSYLAACAIYATIFEESPEGISFHSSIDATTAEYLQEIADSVAMSDLDRWVRNATLTIADFGWFQEGDMVFFEDSSENANNYYWDFGDGEFSTLQNAVHGYDEPGEYEVMHIAFGDCNNDTAYQTITVHSSAIVDEKSEYQNHIDIFPNPIANGRLFIADGKYDSYEIYDISGKLIKDGELIGHRLINLKSFPNGIYLIKLTSQDAQKIKRISILK